VAALRCITTSSSCVLVPGTCQGCLLLHYQDGQAIPLLYCVWQLRKLPQMVKPSYSWSLLMTQLGSSSSIAVAAVNGWQQPAAWCGVHVPSASSGPNCAGSSVASCAYRVPGAYWTLSPGFPVGGQSQQVLFQPRSCVFACSVPLVPLEGDICMHSALTRPCSC